MNNNNEQFLRSLLDVLPLYAEEDNIREELYESELISKISKKGNDSFATGSAIAIVRCLLESLALLDPVELEGGRWAFISFPASLMARSILETMANRKNTFFRSTYWSQGSGTPEKDIEEQRNLLKKLEVQRTSGTTYTVPTIRTVHVAWGIIRLGTKFLMYKREDKERPEVAGHGFPGGRFNLKDLPPELQCANSLRKVFSLDSKLVTNALQQTLERELNEELDLQPNKYEAKYLQTLAPYRKIEGSKNNHAFTQYNIAIYSVIISAESEVKLLEKSALDQKTFKWFTVDELVRGARADGTKAFINALIEDDSFVTKEFLLNIPNSSNNQPFYRTKNEAVELPINSNFHVLMGDSGKQKELPINLEQDEWKLLMIMGWHVKDLEVDHDDSNMIMLGNGWIKLLNDHLKTLAKTLAQKFASKSLQLVEYNKLGYCRLSIDAEYLYFQPDCFSYLWDFETDDKPIILTLRSFETEWAYLKGQALSIDLSPTSLKAIRKIEDGHEPDGNIDSIKRSFFENFKSARSIGLHQFLSFKNEWFEILPPRKSE